MRELLVEDTLGPLVIERPDTRGECRDAVRPCPFVSCRHHLYLDVNPHTGTIKINFPDLEPWELEHTCALDVADRGGITLEEVGEILNLTRERVRQIEVTSLLAARGWAVERGIEAKDTFLAHPPGNELVEAEPKSPEREESARRARIAYVQRQRAKEGTK